MTKQDLLDDIGIILTAPLWLTIWILAIITMGVFWVMGEIMKICEK